MDSTHSPSSIPSQSKKGGGIFSNTRRQSLNISSTHLPPGIGYSPGLSNSPPASSGIPAFRALRSLLPFGPNKNATPNSSAIVSSPNTSKSPFSGFGSVRRSMQKDRERKISLSNDVIRPVITIDQNPLDEGVVRRSVSFSELERPESTVDSPSSHRPANATMSAFALRTPSPGPPLSLDLSTIMEADNSGMSRLSPLASTPPPLSHGKPSSPIPEVMGEDISALDLSTTHLADQVRNAFLSGDSSPNSISQWRNVDKAVVIIDADEKDNLADASFFLDKADPQLIALLSPNSLKNSSQSPEKRQSLQIRASPTTPTKAGSPNTRLPRTRQASSFLPRLRLSSASMSPSTSHNFNPVTQPSTSPAFPPKSSPAKGKTPLITRENENSATPSPNFPRTLSLSRPGKLLTPDRSTSLSNPQASAFETDPYSPNPSSATSKGPVRTLRRIVLGTNSQTDNASAVATPTPLTRLAASGRASLDLRRPATSASEIGLGRSSLDIQRGKSFDSRRRPSPTTHQTRPSTTPEQTESTTTTYTESSTPSPETPNEEPIIQRRSVDSTVRPSSDSTVSRPGSSAARLLERERKTSSRMPDSPADRLTIPKTARSRKRSMSVQERVGKANRPSSGSTNTDSRPGSSLSVGRPSRGGQGIAEHGERSGPKAEWLGPRSLKAFRAAGLLDSERDTRLKERDASGNDPLDRLRGSVSGMLAPSPLGSNSDGGGPNRFASLRGSTEFNPGSRAHSRTTFSDIGGPTSRRGSESLSAHSGGNGFGLMESPTFTSSSVSRGERDVPRSASTAPTSLSDNFGYFARDRERDRDKEEIRELKDRHATEVAALLAALSDSQRTVRMLRDENSEIRGSLERFAGVLEANDKLRRVCADLQRECHELRRECAGLRSDGSPVSFRSSSVLRAPGIASSRSGGSTNSSLRTALPKLAMSSPLATDVTPRYEEEYNNTVIIHDSIDDSPDPRWITDDPNNHEPSPLDGLLPTSTSTPFATRRLSTTSSIFPAPPANMTMLLDDEGLSLSNRSSADHSATHFHFQPGSPTPKSKAKSHSRSSSSASSPPLPVTFQSLSSAGPYPNKSIASATSISPTVEFSMVTGSPRSLFLRPEHEQLLGDLESLDLGTIPPIDLGTSRERDDW